MPASLRPTALICTRWQNSRIIIVIIIIIVVVVYIDSKSHTTRAMARNITYEPIFLGLIQHNLIISTLVSRKNSTARIAGLVCSLRYHTSVMLGQYIIKNCITVWPKQTLDHIKQVYHGSTNARCTYE